MNAAIMAGGFGTRLRPLTCNTPKPMTAMVNRPMMHHIVRTLHDLGIRNIVSLLYYQPEVIESYFGDGSAFGVTMNYMRSEADYGTAGSVRNAYDFLKDDRIIIISGDVLTDIDIAAAIRFHEEKSAKATLVLTRVSDPLSFGVVMTDDRGKITRFLEKPQWGEVFSDTINTGIYILEPEVLDLIPPKQDFDFSKDLYPKMLAEDLGLYGYIAEGYWRDIGDLNEYQRAHSDILEGNVKLPLPGLQLREHVFVGRDCVIPDDVHFDGTVIIGDNVHIASGSYIANTVIGDGSRIGSGAQLRDSVLWSGVQVGDNACVNNDVLCNNVAIGNRAFIGRHSFIADNCRIGDGAVLADEVKLWTDKEVDAGASVPSSIVHQERWSRDLFTDARIGGLANIQMTPEFGAKLGAALGASFGAGRTVAISRDADNVSRMIHRAMTTGLMSAGVNVNDLQRTPIPLTRSELLSGRQVAGVHVRKSPRDPRYTDIIFFNAEGKDMPSGKTKSIERLFFGEEYKRAPYADVGTIYFPERTNENYIARFLEHLDEQAIRSSRMKVAFDYSFGVASTLLPNILGNLGPEVVSVNAYLDSTRMARRGDEQTAALEKLGSVVTSLGYDLGIVIDPGAEKIAAVSENGAMITQQRLLTIVTALVLEAMSGSAKKIAVPIVATGEVETIARQYGAEVVYTKNSHSAMMEATSDKEVAFVGGTRGGFIFPEFLFSIDGMFAAAKIMELMARTGKTLGGLDTELPRRAMMAREAECPWESKGTVMRHAMQHSENKRRQLIDGVKILLDNPSGSATDDWVLLIPDKERAVFHVVVETDNEATSAALADEYAALVGEWRK